MNLILNLGPATQIRRAFAAVRKTPFRRAVAIGCALALVLASCASDEPADAGPAAPAEPAAPPPAEPATPPSPTEAPEAATDSTESEGDQPPPQIIATTTIWADITRNVTCGGLAEVESIIPPVADPHDFEPSLADRARLDAADLIVENGLELEQALADTLASAVADGTPIFSAAEQVTTIEFDADMFGGHGHEDEHDDHEDEHDHDEEDEHDDHEDEHDHDEEDEHDDHEDEHDHDEEDMHDDHEDEHDHDEEDEHDDHEDEHDHDEEDEHDDHEDEHDEEDEHDDDEDEHDHDDEHDDHEHDDHEDEHDHDEEDEHDDHEDEHDHDEEDEHDDHEDEHDHDEEDMHDDHEDEDGHHDHDHGSEDPHVWLDPVRVAQAVEGLAAVLVEEHGLDAGRISACVDAYVAELAELHEDITDTLEAVPAASRKLVTNHDAFGYFADRYNFEVIGTVIPSVSTLAEPSPASLEALAELIEETGVPAIFSEYLSHSRDVAAALADRLDGVSVVSLYSGALGPEGSGAETYLAMMRVNAQTIADALGG